MIRKPKEAPVIERKKGPRKPKSASREWLDAILFAVVVATLVRWLIFTPYTIPTASMERSLLVGDFLVVSKLPYEAATPITPLQLPLSHQTIWGTNIPAYLNWIQLPQWRLPGLSEIERGDVVVFNYPAELEHTLDVRTNYIKRCVGLPADTLRITEQQIMVNGLTQEKRRDMQFMYHVQREESPSERFIRQYGLYDSQPYGNGLLASLTTPLARKIKTLPFVTAVIPIAIPAGEKQRM